MNVCFTYAPSSLCHSPNPSPKPPKRNNFWDSLDAKFASYKGKMRVYFIVTSILSLSERKKKHFKRPEKKQSVLGEDTLDQKDHIISQNQVKADPKMRKVFPWEKQNSRILNLHLRSLGQVRYIQVCLINEKRIIKNRYFTQILLTICVGKEPHGCVHDQSLDMINLG